MEIFLGIVVFGLAMAGMSVGVLLSDRRLRGSCGGVGVVSHGGDELSCGACPKADAELCPSDEPLVQLAQIGHPNPREHR